MSGCQALVERRKLTLWVTSEAIEPSGRRGAPQNYTDLAIETALALRLLFQFPFR